MTPDQLHEFFKQFQDHLAPKLDTYEQAIYLYVFRHTRFVGLDETVIGFRSARTRLAMGVGEKGKPMADKSIYPRLNRLEKMGCIVKTSVHKVRGLAHHGGFRIRLYLPHEITDLIPAEPVTPEKEIDIEQIDFFDEPNRLAILKREGGRCFYTLKKIDADSFILDHVVSRPTGGNDYRNLVAVTKHANDRKGAMSAEDFIFVLYREGTLDEDQFHERLKAVADLKAGLLKPVL